MGKADAIKQFRSMRIDENSTESDAMKMSEDIYDSAQIGRKRKVPVASAVGIFWVVDGKPLAFGAPLLEAEPYGELKNYKQSHYSLWEFLRHSRIVPQDSDYEDYPRGRVVYNTRSDSLMFFADNCILKDKPMVRLLLGRLHLPLSTKTESDPHYKCKKCGG